MRAPASQMSFSEKEIKHHLAFRHWLCQWFMVETSHGHHPPIFRATPQVIAPCSAIRSRPGNPSVARPVRLNVEGLDPRLKFEVDINSYGGLDIFI